MPDQIRELPREGLPVDLLRQLRTSRLHQRLDDVEGGGPGDQGTIDRADRGADDHVRENAGLEQCPCLAHLDGSAHTAAAKHKRHGPGVRVRALAGQMFLCLASASRSKSPSLYSLNS